MHELPALNYDLLPLVASFTESRRTLCAIMLTCHDAYRFCPRLVLQQEAGLHGNKSIHRFLRFMRAEDHRRWQYLRSLRFGETEFCVEMAQRLAADLPRATNLERLVFDDAEVTLNTADPSLRLALAALPNVKDLVIPVGHHAAAFLETISWPLETAELLTDMHPEDDYWSQGPRELNYEWSAALLLKNARATLKSVTSHYGDDRAYVDFVLPVYPNVTRLVMTGHEVDYPAAAAWSRAFPNVRHLEVSTSLEAMHEYWADGDIYDFAWRRANSLAVMLRAGRWAELESYTGSLPDLYASGIAGRIRKISAKPLKQKHWKLFAAVVAQARPRELKLEFMAEVDYQRIPELLRSPGLEELVALTLPVHIQLDPEGDVNPGLSDFIVRHALLIPAL